MGCLPFIICGNIEFHCTFVIRVRSISGFNELLKLRRKVGLELGLNSRSENVAGL